jgi:hypothetical protein
MISSPTNAAWILGRILVVNSDDLPRVRELQDLLKLYPAPGTEASVPFNGPPVTPNNLP